MNNHKKDAEEKTVMIEQEKERLLAKIKKGPSLLPALAQEMEKSQNKIVQMIDSLRAAGYNITLVKELQKDNFVYEVRFVQEPQIGEPVHLETVGRKEIKILLISDTAFGLRTHQPEIVATALKEGVRQKVDFAIHCGNIVAGKPTLAKYQDFLGTTFYSQVNFVRKMPHTPYKIYFINGPRDITHDQDVARVLCTPREKWRDERDLEANFFITGSKAEWKIKVMHLKKGSPYTVSYPIQKVKENFTSAIRYVIRKSHCPNLLILGGLSTPLMLPAKKPGDMISISLPGLCATPPSQEAEIKKGNCPELGFTIITIRLDEKGNPVEVQPEFHLFTAYEQVEHPYVFGGFDIVKFHLSEDEKKVLEALKERPRRLGELSRYLDYDKSLAEKIIEDLKKHFEISYDEASKKYALVYNWAKRKFHPVSLEESPKKIAVVASISDTHIGDKAAKEELISLAYKEAEKAGADVITHSGDVFTGTNAYPGQEFDLAWHGADAQLDRGLKIWPSSPIPTIIIAGSSHEKVYWVKSGYNIVRRFAETCKNMEYIGGEHLAEGTKTVNGIVIRLVHPKGGIPYGKSYRLQRWLENLTEEQDNSSEGVRMLLVGHLHVAIFMHYKGISSFLVPCLEENTNYLKERGLIPWLGMWITKLEEDRFGNVVKVSPKYISFEKRE